MMRKKLLSWNDLWISRSVILRNVSKRQKKAIADLIAESIAPNFFTEFIGALCNSRSETLF